MNETETRAEHIDPALKAAGWGVVEGSRILREYHITPGRIEGRGRRGRPEIADYVLVYRNLIVIDECHRGGANDESNWRGILDYFSPALQLGLTTTPKREANVDTYAYFGEQYLRDFQDNEKSTPSTSPPPPRQRVKVKLADGKALTIQHMTMTSYWHPDGTPMSAQQFMEMLFGKLPEFFKDVDELRSLWSAPATRATLLDGLAEARFGHEQMIEMQKIIDAEKSDLFDVLAYVACAMPPLTREERASKAKVEISSQFNPKQQAFLDFVLSHYVNVGVQELDQEKLTPLLKLKYHDPIPDAIADLGAAVEIKEVFVGFQKFLYVPAA